MCAAAVESGAIYQKELDDSATEKYRSKRNTVMWQKVLYFPIRSIKFQSSE